MFLTHTTTGMSQSNNKCDYSKHKLAIWTRSMAKGCLDYISAGSPKLKKSTFFMLSNKLPIFKFKGTLGLCTEFGVPCWNPDIQVTEHIVYLLNSCVGWLNIAADFLLSYWFWNPDVGVGDGLRGRFNGTFGTDCKWRKYSCILCTH